MAKAVNRTIKGMIERLAKKEIEGVRLHRIDAKFDMDSDGDSIVRIAVIVDHPEKIRSAALTSFARAVRHEFAHKADVYPLISFRSIADDKGMSSEAA